MQRSYRGNKTRKQVLYTVLAAVTYQIWRIRYEAYWNMTVYSVDKSIEDIKYIVRHRAKFYMPKACSIVDREWINHL